MNLMDPYESIWTYMNLYVPDHHNSLLMADDIGIHNLHIYSYSFMFFNRVKIKKFIKTYKQYYKLTLC